MENETSNSSARRGLPGSIRADFPATLLSQALTPSPVECVYFDTDTVGSITHECCKHPDLLAKRPPPCYLCSKFEKKPSAP